MHTYMLIMVCISILLLCGVLKAPCRAAGLSGFSMFFILLSAGVLSRFDWRASVEVCINAGAAAMVFIPVLLTESKVSGGGNGVLSVVVLFAVLSAAAEVTGVFYGSENGLLCGVMAGLSAAALCETPDNAVFAACTVPVLADIGEAFAEMAATGYASLEIDTVTLTAQMIGVSIAVAAVWISSISAAFTRME